MWAPSIPRTSTAFAFSSSYRVILRKVWQFTAAVYRQDGIAISGYGRSDCVTQICSAATRLHAACVIASTRATLVAQHVKARGAAMPAVVAHDGHLRTGTTVQREGGSGVASKASHNPSAHALSDQLVRNQ